MTNDNVEQLLKVLKRKKDKKLKYQDDVLQFLDFYNIKSGRQYVRNKIIKRLYYAWSKNPIPENNLALRLNDYFRSLSKGNTYYYKINQKALNLTKDAYEALAKEKKRVRVIKHQKIVEFLKENDIEAGQYITKAEVLRDLFLDWAAKKKYASKRLTSKKKFYLVLNLYLPNKVNSKQELYFLVNQNLKAQYERLQHEKAKSKKEKKTKPKV